MFFLVQVQLQNSEFHGAADGVHTPHSMLKTKRNGHICLNSTMMTEVRGRNHKKVTQKNNVCLNKQLKLNINLADQQNKHTVALVKMFILTGMIHDYKRVLFGAKLTLQEQTQ